MFKEKTVFVLGAGASKEFGMPVGAELKEIVANKLDFKEVSYQKPEGGDELLFRALCKSKCTDVIGPGKRFKSALNTYISIDEFLASDPNDENFQLTGKIAIVRSILEKEASSILHAKSYGDELKTYRFLEDRKDQKDNEIGTWLGEFIRRLRGGVSIDQIDKLFENVAFINFNYDRCLEQGLAHGLSIAYSKTLSDALLWVRSATILRPYGSVGSFWQNEDSFNPFGGLSGNENNQAEQLVNLSGGILTFAEPINTTKQQHVMDLYRNVIDVVDGANKLVFLGFGFHEPNMKIIRPKNAVNNRVTRPKDIFATAFRAENNNKNAIEQMLQNFGVGPSSSNNRVLIDEGTCLNLFKNNQFGF